MPLQWSRRSDKKRKSEWHPSCRDMRSWRLGTEDAISNKRLMNKRPWGMMRMAKLRWPRRESNCFVMFSVAQKDLVISRMRYNLSSGRDAFISTESRVMLRNSRHVSGLFFVLTGKCQEHENNISVWTDMSLSCRVGDQSRENHSANAEQRESWLCLRESSKVPQKLNEICMGCSCDQKSGIQQSNIFAPTWCQKDATERGEWEWFLKSQ